MEGLWQSWRKPDEEDEAKAAEEEDEMRFVTHYSRCDRHRRFLPGQLLPDACRCGTPANGEISMWGDYHLRELALLILREAKGESIRRFFPNWSPQRTCTGWDFHRFAFRNLSYVKIRLSP